jgi:type II secretory pathway component PulC
MQIGEEEILAGGDILLAVENIPLTSEENIAKVQEYVWGLPAKTRFSVTILRRGKVQNLQWFK